MFSKSLASIALDRRKHVSLQTQLALKLRVLIQEGFLKSGEAMPSSRALAADLQISRNTVSYAYDRLIGEGYVDSRPRSGLYVSELLAATANLKPAENQNLACEVPFQRERISSPRPFRCSQPDVRLFPLAMWNRARARALRRHGTSLLHYQSELPLGLPTLRRAIAGYLRDRRGVRCDWQQVAITSGSQQALFMLAQLLLRPGDSAWMENPGYSGARRAWMSAGASIRPVAVDERGLIPPRRGAVRAALIYSTPSRQYPTGACLSLARRLELIRWASATGTWIIEDDYDSEFRYRHAPLPSLHSLDPHGRVIYVGTMSKTLFPSLRIGYVVLPPDKVSQFADLKSVLDDHGTLIDQATATDFLQTGAYYTHIRRCRREYGIRLDTFLGAVAKTSIPLVFPHTDGGINVSGLLPEKTTDEGWAIALAAAGVDCQPHSRLAIGQVKPGLLFGFTAFESSSIKAAVNKMQDAWPTVG